VKSKILAHAEIQDGKIILTRAAETDEEKITQLFRKKTEWEERNQHEYLLQVEFELDYQKRTYKQLRTVFKLVELIWSSMEKDPPTEEEKYSLYNDLLYVYADKKINRFTGEKVPIRISECNSMEGARFIDGLIYHLATMCDLDYNAQSSVVDVIHEWQTWRGRLEIDPVDYVDLECTRLLTEAEWREKNKVSAASGRGGVIELAHIVSRGSDAADIGEAWNWVALTHDEHMEQHRIGWDAFLQIYPHLRGRVGRARNLAGKLELEFKREQQAIEYKPENLAAQALEE